MNDETKIWLQYSKENYSSAKILLKNNLYNSCLQNFQQSIEKALKAVLIEKKTKAKKTHSILELKKALSDIGVFIHLSEEDCDFIDSIYLPSKYPLNTALPYFEPDDEICNKALSISKSLLNEIIQLLEAS